MATMGMSGKLQIRLYSHVSFSLYGPMLEQDNGILQMRFELS